MFTIFWIIIFALLFLGAYISLGKHKWYMSKYTVYCGCMNNENIYRNYANHKQAINGFKKLAIKKYANLTDITVKGKKGWTPIEWTK